MKRYHEFVQRKGWSIFRLYASHFALFLLTLFLVTTILPVAAQHRPSDLRLLLLAQNSTSQVDASTLLEQGSTLYEAGRFSEAATLWQQAAQYYEAQGDRITQALSLSYLSLAYQDLGQWQEAQKAISQSLELLTINQQQTTNNKQILAQALNTQASLQLAMGQAEAALDTWKQAESAYTQAGDETGMLGSQLNQAQALQTLGLYRRAQNLLEQVNKKLQLQPDSLLKAQGLQSLGVVLQVVGDLQKSQDVLEQSLAITQRLDSSLNTSAIFFSLGNTARALQDYQKAIELYHKAAANAIAPLNKLEAQLNQLNLLVQTEQWKAAIAFLPKIQSQLPNLPPSRNAVYARVNLAQSLMKLGMRDWEGRTQGITSTGTRGQGKLRSWGLGDKETSQTTVLVALDTSPSAIAQIIATAVQQARMLKDPRGESYALGALGKLYKQTQHLPDAQKLTQQALQIAQAINASDIAYRWQWQLGQILRQQGELTQAMAAYTEAVNTLQSLRTDLVAINPDVQFSFQENVEPVYRELVQLLLQPPQPPYPGGVSQENLKKAREVIESLQVAQLDNFFRQACLNAKPEQIDQVDPTAAVIYPIILADRLAVILSLVGQPLRYYETRLPQSEVEEIVEQVLQSVSPAFSKKERLRLSQEVYDWLIRPAETQLAETGVKTLVFVLDGSLRNLPLAALYDGQQYLVEKYSIALSPGLQLLEPRSLVPEQIKVLTGGLSESRQGFSPLPAVELEVKQIASEVPSKILLNQEFQKTTLENQINSTPFTVVHLATHGQFSSKAEDTFLLTWDGRINVKDLDELLQGRERENINPIELLVLSACQTAAGDQRATLGLAGVAVQSGARSTLATLWAVQDTSTAELMAEFYRNLAQPNVSKAEALRQAQLALLKQANFERPFFWAAFVLVGNWL